MRKKERKRNVKMLERTKCDACEGHRAKTAPSSHDYRKYFTHSMDLGCFKQRSARPTVIWPLLPSTKWVTVCFQMSECNRKAKRLSSRRSGDPDVATRSSFQQQTLTLGDVLSRICSHRIAFTVLQPSWSNRYMSFNFSPLVQGLLCVFQT